MTEFKTLLKGLIGDLRKKKEEKWTWKQDFLKMTKSEEQKE